MLQVRLDPLLGDVLDIAVVAVLVYAVIVSVRGARAHLALLGLGILGLVYLVARELGLALAAGVLEAFFTVSLIVLIVVFQEEFRQLFERVAVWSLRRERPPAAGGGWIDALVRAVGELVATQRGALVVIPGADPIERHVEGGVALGGQVSYPLLLSLFDPNSPGHDGAVLLEGDRIQRFAVHLPLSSNRDVLGARGTRHAAALGLAERTDALCIVVSEERGTVSLARDGALRRLPDLAELTRALRAWQEEHAPAETTGGVAWRRLVLRWREAGIALAVAAAMWVLVIPGSKVVEVVVRVPVEIENLPEGYVVEEVTPAQVDAVVEGLRRDLFFVERRGLSVAVDAFLVPLGRRTFELSPAAVRAPSGISVKSLEPSRIRISVRTSNGEGAREPAAGGA